MSWTCSSGAKIKIYQNFAGKPPLKRPFGRQRTLWEDITKTDVKEICCKDVHRLRIVSNVKPWYLRCRTFRFY